ncbi:hypothetical protein STRAU_0435 [Streptomyces aurantiacus JA 4570]|uniref:Core-binding (CB) domain-containing protein n=1 Tax=Streptomyces aurantiacus JA 4570 TaxID=1286094 RepID=S3ZTE4_9ACTN|nr:hypothetical protein STRAU_0435 [Streptomyces aurantiacus JA 4570]
MAGYIEDRWINKKKDPTSGKRERTARYGKGTRYRVAGIPGVRNMSFDTLEDAKAWLRRAGTDSERGEFVDPRDGSITLADYVTRFWKEGVRGAPGTIKRVDARFRLHILPHLGTVGLRDISATVLRGYIATLEGECAPRYTRQILTTLSNIFETAIDDKRLVRNPMRAKSVHWPKVPEDQREAWPLETAQRMRDAIKARYRIAVVVALGCGLRQGEVFGFSPEDVDFQRGIIRVRRQVQLLNGRLYFALPKGGKTRIVDMPGSVAAELAAHFLQYPAVEVELPWGGPEPEREKRMFPLALTTTYGNALRATTRSGSPPSLRPGSSRCGRRGSAGRHPARMAFTSSDTPSPRSSSKRVSPSSRWPDGSATPARRSRSTTTRTSRRRPVGRGVLRSTRCLVRSPRTSLRAGSWPEERVAQHALCHPFVLCRAAAACVDP